MRSSYEPQTSGSQQHLQYIQCMVAPEQQESGQYLRQTQNLAAATSLDGITLFSIADSPVLLCPGWQLEGDVQCAHAGRRRPRRQRQGQPGKLHNLSH
jgi:hypothetical protein